MTKSSIPTTWSALLERRRSIDESMLDVHLERAEELASEPSGIEIANNFGGSSASLAPSVIVLGSSPCLPVLNGWMSLVPRAIAAIDADFQYFYAAYDILSFLVTAECAGLTLPTEAYGVEARWLPLLANEQQTFSEPEQQTLALIALQAAQPAIAARFIGESSQPFRPGQRFEFNFRYFIRYLVQAWRNQAVPEDVFPAWYQFIELFPYKLAAETVQWIDLLLTGCVMAKIAGAPIHRVADNLHKHVHSLP
jgi:hypothetical protein